MELYKVKMKYIRNLMNVDKTNNIILPYPTQRKPDISLAKKELDWEPKVMLDEGL